MERPNWRRLFLCGVLVQLLDALGSHNGTLPTSLRSLRLRLPAATNKLPKLCYHGFWAARISTTCIGDGSFCNQKTTTKNQLDQCGHSYGGFWQLLPLQHPLLLPHRQLRSTPKRLVRSNRTTPQPKPMGTSIHLRWSPADNSKQN